MENKLGDKERAQTLFENILSSYPKRVDVWSCYVDCLIKSENIDLARYYNFTVLLQIYRTIINIYYYDIFNLVLSFVSFLINFMHSLVCRKVLERACVQTLPSRKMKTLFTKFVNFEEKYGTSETVARVRQMAVDYVEKHT